MRQTKILFTKVLNVILMTGTFLLIYSSLGTNTFGKGTMGVLSVLFLFLYVVFGKTYDSFLISYMGLSEMIYSQVLALFFTDALMYMILCVAERSLVNALPVIGTFAAQIIVSAAWCALVRTVYYRLTPSMKTAVIYDMREGTEDLIATCGLDQKFDVQKTISAQEALDNIDALRKFDCVFLSGVHSADRNVILKYCIVNNIRSYVIPRVGDLLLSSGKPMHMLHLPMMLVERYQPSPVYAALKRTFDIVSSLIAIILASPIMLITAICIYAEDHGPVLYSQCRLTKDGKRFMIHKFRSMRVDAEKDGVARLSSGENDSRITKVGSFIRKCRIDELPQLFDILRGDLSVVGPRPERPEIAQEYEKEMPEFVLRLQAKAGLTGYAQVYGKYNTAPYDKLQMDLMYIAQASFFKDLQIIFATFKILFMPESTEGIAEGQTTAMASTPAKKKVQEVKIHE